MTNDKYVLENDKEINNAGFSNMSYYDKERMNIIQEMQKLSKKSFEMTKNGQFIISYSGYGGLILGTLFFGLHRLYNGKIFSGLLFAITLNGLGIWWIIDIFIILSGKFTDKDHKPIDCRKANKLVEKLNFLEQCHARGEL